MLVARVEVDANTSCVAARINDLNVVYGTNLIIALPVCEEWSARHAPRQRRPIIRPVPLSFL
jgi:hypothetical protein